MAPIPECMKTAEWSDSRASLASLDSEQSSEEGELAGTAITSNLVAPDQLRKKTVCKSTVM